MIVVKDKSGLIFLIAVLVILPVYIHGYILWKGGMSLVALKLHIYFVPVSALFMFFVYNMYRSLSNKLIITESGILIEDFSPIEFPWRIITRASTVSQPLPRGGTCLWLVLHTRCDGDYIGRKTRNMNKLIGINGIPVCNLATYNGSAEEIVSAINNRANSG